MGKVPSSTELQNTHNLSRVHMLLGTYDLRERLKSLGLLPSDRFSPICCTTAFALVAVPWALGSSGNLTV